ncbi:MAG: hypothetical protein COA94_03000 [Rickettsiales bacterium]|nr:MAG: hypothetical protein COA94_03000 [Rickettsiales bacterium]
MQTNNFDMELMVPGQENKDVTFNESLLKIDSFLNLSVNGFRDEVPDEVPLGEKYIITNGEYQHHICYSSHESKGVQYFRPKQGMVVFSVQAHSFMLYHEHNWVEIMQAAHEPPREDGAMVGGAVDAAVVADDADAVNVGGAYVDDNFTGIDDEFIAPPNKKHFSLYLNSNTTLNFDNVLFSEVTILIKQCYNAARSLTWPHNILWPDGSAHIMSEAPNAIDIVKLYRMPESTHFLGKIIGQNYQF